MKISAKTALRVIGTLLLLVFTVANLMYAHSSTTVIKVHNVTGYVLTDIKITIANESLTDAKIDVDDTIKYKTKNQHEGSIKFEANLGNERIFKEFGYVTHGMREDYFVQVLSSDDIQIEGH